MKKLRAYLKSKRYKASGQPSSGGDANADLNQPIMGNSNAGTSPKGGKAALKVSAKKANAGKSGAGAFQGKRVLDDDASRASSKRIK